MNNSQEKTTNVEQKNILQVQEKVLSFLERKYEKKFQCLASEDISALNNHYTFIISEKDNTIANNEFKAFYYPTENLYEDGYFGVVLNKLITNRLYQLGLVDNDNYKVYIAFQMSVFPSELTNKSSLNDAISVMGSIECNVYLFVNKQINIESVVDKVREVGVTGTLFFYQVDDEVLESISQDTYKETVSKIIVKKVQVMDEGKIDI